MRKSKVGVVTKVRRSQKTFKDYKTFERTEGSNLYPSPTLNLCLQDAGRKIQVIHDSMDIVKEIIKLINLSPKRKTLFGSKLVDNNQAGGTITPLCPTHWTVQTAALDSVITSTVVLSHKFTNECE